MEWRMDAKVNADETSEYSSFRGWRPDRCGRIALIFQGGGALGAYQAGVYEALHEADIEPDWVTGVSIGAINAAIIAGNSRANRLDRLRAFWHRITERKVWAFTPDGDLFRRARNATSSMMTIALGQPGFFKPHDFSPWMSLAGARTATSCYDTAPLAKTLVEFVDFSLINERQVRFAVGAVNVQTGNFIYFDNFNEEIAPEHVMASARPAADLADGQDRHGLLLGRRHRFEYAAAAFARPGRPREHARLPGRPLQRAWPSAT
jgi:NTE family protein